MQHNKLFLVGAVLTAGGLFGLAVGDLLTFKAGDPIKSAEVNANFSTLKAAVQSLEAPIGVSRLAVEGTPADGKVLKLQGSSLTWADDIVGSPGTSYTADGTSLQLVGTTFSVKDGGVGNAKLADGAVTASKISLPLSLSSSSATALSIVNTAGNALSSVSSGGGIGVLGRSTARGIVGTQGDPGLSCAGTFGVGGCAESSGVGVLGRSVSGNGVRGISDTGSALYGDSGLGIGVWGNSTTRGVVGTLGGTSCAGTYAVGGCAASGVGVFGSSSGNDAVVGVSTSPDHAAVAGSNTGGGFAAYFEAGTAVCSFKAGTTGWTCSSDRNLKENFEPVDATKVLEAVAKMPITTWNMKGSKTRQMGPSAQDFYAAFRLGDGDKSINTTDAQGVALAAIQGLNTKLEAQNRALEARVQELELQLATLHSLQAEVAALKTQIKR
ncbi:tail fiber domain-containing protein [Calidithermus timidus]|uniref:tail fiber domain-containing protein n=1 Tax=Calidithermus timidus TaxID=307124 RepID=UPI0003A1741D|nr:tail fiber domain-containing protein [Calidithermus timidus]